MHANTCQNTHEHSRRPLTCHYFGAHSCFEADCWPKFLLSSNSLAYLGLLLFFSNGEDTVSNLHRSPHKPKGISSVRQFGHQKLLGPFGPSVFACAYILESNVFLGNRLFLQCSASFCRPFFWSFGVCEGCFVLSSLLFLFLWWLVVSMQGGASCVAGTLLCQ